MSIIQLDRITSCVYDAGMHPQVFSRRDHDRILTLAYGDGPIVADSNGNYDVWWAMLVAWAESHGLHTTAARLYADYMTDLDSTLMQAMIAAKLVDSDMTLWDEFTIACDTIIAPAPWNTLRDDIIALLPDVAKPWPLR